MGERESAFQAKVTKELKARFPGCLVLKNDANYMQGFPDLLILYNDKWVALECKRNAGSSHRPNQDYYVETLNEMSYAAFVYPENWDEVLYDIQQTFEPSR